MEIYCYLILVATFSDGISHHNLYTECACHKIYLSPFKGVSVQVALACMVLAVQLSQFDARAKMLYVIGLQGGAV